MRNPSLSDFALDLALNYFWQAGKFRVLRISHHVTELWVSSDQRRTIFFVYLISNPVDTSSQGAVLFLRRRAPDSATNGRFGNNFP